MNSKLKDLDLVEQNLHLRAEIVRLSKVVDALAESAERAVNEPNSDYGVFQSTILLEGQVRLRTHDLEAALQRNERVRRFLKVANEKLEQSEKRFRNIIEYTPVGMCIVDKEFIYSLANKAYCDIVGYDKQELNTMTPLDITYPDDLGLSKDRLQSLINGEIDSYQLEKRYIHKSGKLVWIHLTTSLLRDSQGAPHSLIAQIQDITSRKLSEEKLRLAATVYNYSNEAMMITDASSRIVATNPAFTALTGYSAEEVLGESPHILSSSRHDEGFYENLWKTLATKSHWEGDVWNRKKGGEMYAEWLSITVVHDDKGAIQNYVALFSDVTEEKKAAEKTWEYANYDTLTNLPNRRLFLDRLDQEIKKANRSGEAFALLFIDLDHFKEVNDKLGHQAGDELLLQVSNRVKAKVRASDTVARMGGDEFTAILPNVVNFADVGNVTQSMVDALCQPFELEQGIANISSSIGVIMYPSDAKDIQSLLKGADEAMYVSKTQGKNQFSYFQSAIKDIA